MRRTRRVEEMLVRLTLHFRVRCSKLKKVALTIEVDAPPQTQALAAGERQAAHFELAIRPLHAIFVNWMYPF